MNTGAISARYAKALLRYVDETGGGARVFDQVRDILAHPDNAPSKLEPELERFVALLVGRGRTDCLKLALGSFVAQYCREKNICLGHLTTVTPSPALERRLLDLLHTRTGAEVILETAVDPALIGGFVLELDDIRMDASVRGQLERIRREFVALNNRKV